MGAGASLSKGNAPRKESMPGFEGRYLEVDGYTIGFESFAEAGTSRLRTRGCPTTDAIGPGHTGEVGLPGTEVLEVSPTDEYDETMAVLSKNLEAMG
jgi:hypothetical protein